MRHHGASTGKSACGNGDKNGKNPGADPNKAGHLPTRAAGLVLAAGAGRRLGGHPKALLPYRGGLLVEHTARVLRDGGCDPVYVVLGAAAEEVRARAAGLDGCHLVDNPGWAEGMGSSLRAGLGALAGGDAADGEPPRHQGAAAGQSAAPPAVVVALVDQPEIGAQAVARLLSGGVSRARLAAAAYHGRRGHPVLLGADHWPAISAAAAGDRGARGYLSEHRSELALVECADIASPCDIDTPADLRWLSVPSA